MRWDIQYVIMILWSSGFFLHKVVCGERYGLKMITEQLKKEKFCPLWAGDRNSFYFRYGLESTTLFQIESHLRLWHLSLRYWQQHNLGKQMILLVMYPMRLLRRNTRGCLCVTYRLNFG